MHATFTRPDGTSWKANMMANWDGTYKISFPPDMVGSRNVKPRWRGDVYNAGAEGTPITFTVVASTIIPGIPTCTCTPQ